MLQARRVQQVREGAQLPDGLLGRVLGLIEHRVAFGQNKLPQPHEVEDEGREMLSRRVVQLLGDPLPLLVLKAQDAPGELVQRRLGGMTFRDVGEEDAQAIRRGADVEIEKVARPQAGHHLAPDALARFHAFPDDAAALGLRMAQVPKACAQDPVRIRPDPVLRRLVEIGDAVGPVQREVAVADTGQDCPEPLVRVFGTCGARLRAAPEATPRPFLRGVPRRGHVIHGSAPRRRYNRTTGIFPSGRWPCAARRSASNQLHSLT